MIEAAVVEYAGAAPDTTLDGDMLFVVFAHKTSVPADDVVLTHREGNCLAVLSDDLSSEVADPAVLADAPLVGTTEIAALADLENAANTEQTSITYDVNALFTDFPDLIDTETGSQSLSFCVRISLLDTMGDVEAFREVDITITQDVPQTADPGVVAVDNNPSSESENIGSIEIQTELCDDLTGPLNQGQAFSVCMTPVDADDNTVVRGDIVFMVEDFLFFIDQNSNNMAETEDEVFQRAVQGRSEQPNTFDFSCGLGVTEEMTADGDDAFGCRFTTVLTADFFGEDPQTVMGGGTLDVGFPLTRSTTSAGRQVQFELQLAAATEEKCGSDCFFLFCWFQFLVCAIRDLFD